MSNPKTPQQEKDFKSVQILADAVGKAINDQQGDERFIDLKRIPLICLSIIGIHDNLKELKEMMKESHARFVNQDQFLPVRSIVFGVAGIIGLTTIGAILKLVFAK